MNRPFSRETEAELLRAAEAHPGQGLVLGADGIARPAPAPDWAVLGPKLAKALRGAQKALRRALPHCPADGEHNGDSVFVGEWLDEVNEALALVPAA